MLRIASGAPLVLLLLAAPLTAPAAAQDAGPPLQAATGAPHVEHPLSYPLRLGLNDLDSDARTPAEKDLVSRLASAYAQRGFAPLWLDGDGIAPRARAVMDEIARAREWGLDPAAYPLPPAPAPGAGAEALSGVDVRISFAIVKYAAHARGGRVDPSALSKWLDQKPRPVDATALLATLDKASDPAAMLRGLHPQHAGFANLRKAYLKLIAPASQAAPQEQPNRLPPGPRIEPGERHPDIAILRRRLGVDADAGDEDLYDDRLAAAVRSHLRLSRRKGKPAIDARVRDALNAPPRAAAAASGAIDLKKILVNMERWRWLPDDLGDLHIWNSLTEFETRVTQAGEVIHRERIIVGKPDTQTPVFSDRMEYLVFQPEWGVPNSIKVKQLLPALQAGDDSVLDARGMKILYNGKEKDPLDYNWDKTDIRYVPVYQLPGPSNPLGQVKFMFPNKHDVYMHDTPQKSLFNDGRRTHSAGCIRVRNPRRLAELVMGLDQGWGANEVSAVLDWRGKPSNRVELRAPIAVHNTYFTVLADDDGNLRSVPDIYSHDKRIADALDGVPAAVIAERDPARALERALEDIAPTASADGGAITMKTAREREAARRSRLAEDGLYAAPGAPGYAPYGYNGLVFAAPAPKPSYNAPAKKSGPYRGPPTLFDMVNSFGRN